MWLWYPQIWKQFIQNSYRNLDILYFSRFNLDPEQTKSDTDVWNALEIAQLKTSISSLPLKLGIKVFLSKIVKSSQFLETKVFSTWHCIV